MPSQTKSETAPIKAKLSVLVRDGQVIWRAEENGELLAESRLSSSQAIYFGGKLLNASIEAKAEVPDA